MAHAMNPPDAQFANASFRVDIQALRGLAILLVLLEHTGIGHPAAGYLGVDIFFVISGFLITSIIARDIALDRFSFKTFYYRRSKRLLPAAYVVFLLTALLSPWFLTQSEQHDFSRQLIGAVTFTGNIALWLQTGYFEGAAHLKPLLHVWSLGIEEQYYLLLPAALVFVPRRFWRPGTLLLLVLSLGLCLWFAPLKPGATFYLLPTRGWELALGSLAALLTLDARSRASLAPLFWPALLVLAFIPFFPTRLPHPGLDAMLVCVATLVVILRNHPVVNGKGMRFSLAAVGEFSYSLYLVHWPLFAFANNAYVSEVPVSVRVGIALLSVVLGYLLYRCVERPIRGMEFKARGRFALAAVAASIALIAATLVITRVTRSEVDFEHARRGNLGFGSACEFVDAFSLIPECRNSEHPRFLVWGDSYAKHLVPALLATTDAGVAQATKSVCGPLVGLAAFDEGDYRRPWAEDCLRFNNSVVAFLAAAETIDVVVLSSPFSQYFEGSPWGTRFKTLEQTEVGLMEGGNEIEAAILAMRATVAKVRETGKRAVVVAPPPSADVDVAMCLERTATGLVTFGSVAANCQIPVVEYHARRARVREFLARLPLEAGVAVIDFDGLLCDDSVCATQMNGVTLYRDGGHFSFEGSRSVGAEMRLAKRIESEAR
jgi:peptidoglycan/LPS O-acetylase OafA/YrhL